MRDAPAVDQSDAPEFIVVADGELCDDAIEALATLLLSIEYDANERDDETAGNHKKRQTPRG